MSTSSSANEAAMQQENARLRVELAEAVRLLGEAGEAAAARRRHDKVLAAKFLLAAVTLVIVGSMGGQFYLPILLPAHHWAARSSGSIGRILWSLPAGVAGAFFAWVIVYDAGEPKPAIWLAPLLLGAAATFAMWRAARPKQPTTSRSGASE